MEYTHKEAPWKHTIVDELIDEESKEKIYSTLRKKMKGFGNMNLQMGDFALLSDECYQLSKNYMDMVKDPFFSARYNIDLYEDCQLICQIIKMEPEFEFRIHSGSYTKTLTTYIDITPKILTEPEENYIHLFEQIDSESPSDKTNSIISFSPKLVNTTWHKYINESKKHEKIICLFVITTAISEDEQKIKSFNFEHWHADGSINDRKSVSGGMLIKKDEFSIYSKFKCGSTSLTEWYYANFIQDENVITTLRDSLESNKKLEIYNETFKVPYHYMIHRDPYDRFFSGILQTRVLGVYDVYQSRSSKTDGLLTLPFDLINEDEVIYVFQKIESYVPDFLSDKHLEPFYGPFYKHYRVLTDSGKNVKLIHLNDLNSLPSIISKDIGKPLPQIVRYDMRGKIYKHLDKKECKDKFYSIIFKNKKKVKMFEDIIKMLSRESEEYQKLLEYDKQRTAEL